MSQYKLTYYDIQGLAESARYLFAVAGVEYEDNRIPKSETTYPKLSADIKDTLPWGTVPCLEVDGVKIGQSGAILRFLAKRFNLTGANDIEAAKCDDLAEGMKDFGNEWRALMTVQDEAKKQEMVKTITEVTVPFYLGKFEKILKENGKWLVGKNLTWVDIFVSHYLNMITEHSKMSIVDNFPALKQHTEDALNVPQIKEWIAKRPN